MNFMYPEVDLQAAWPGGAAAPSGLGLAGATAGAGHSELDLNDPQTNLMAMLKIRADLGGADCHFAFPGEVWAMIPQEGNFRLFKTFGFASTRIEEAPEGWRMYNREVLYYMDPDSGEILSEWRNPLLDNRLVEVVHIANDPVNGVFTADGAGVLSAPYPYIAYGDDLIFQWNFFIFHAAAMSRRDYPLYSAGDIDQHAELWGVQGRISEVLNPDITSGACTMSWCRVSQWMPWLEMGNSPGVAVYHSHTYKMMNGPQELPPHIYAHTEKYFPKYFEAPTEWNGPEMQSSASVFKAMVDERRREE
jgi:hypothetical protein